LVEELFGESAPDEGGVFVGVDEVFAVTVGTEGVGAALCVAEERLADGAGGGVEHADGLVGAVGVEVGGGEVWGRGGLAGEFAGVDVDGPRISCRFGEEDEGGAHFGWVVGFPGGDGGDEEGVGAEEVADEGGLFGGLDFVDAEGGVDGDDLVDGDDGEALDLLELLVAEVGLEEGVYGALAGEVEGGSDGPDAGTGGEGWAGGDDDFGFAAVGFWGGVAGERQE
jgi:hypothetical protein